MSSSTDRLSKRRKTPSGSGFAAMTDDRLADDVDMDMSSPIKKETPGKSSGRGRGKSGRGRLRKSLDGWSGSESQKYEPYNDDSDSSSSSSSSSSSYSSSSKATATATATKTRERDIQIPSVAVRFHCDYCRRDISSQLRIKCAECTDFDLCIDCFSVGVELRTHRNDHAYQVVDQMNFPLFCETWGADEELLLLEAIGLYGLGNWTDIADHVSTKTARECEKHYIDTYINVPTAPRPDMDKRFTGVVDPKYRRTNSRSKQQPQPQLSGGPKILPDSCYMVHRQEFETEHLNNAETHIAPLSSIDASDPVAMQKLKLAMLEVYSRSLQQRYQMRHFVVKQGLLDVKKMALADKKRPAQERTLAAKLQVFLQLLERSDYDNFVEGVLREHRLRRWIAELQELRAEGFTNLYAAHEHIAAKEKAPPDHFVFYYASNVSSSGALGSSSSSHKSKSGKSHHSSSSSSSSSSSTSSASAALGAGAGDSGDQSGDSKDGDSDTPGSDPRSKKAKRLGTPLDISQSSSMRLLSQKERDLCRNIRLYPEQYMVIKDTLLRENMRLGHLKKRAARQLIKIDLNKTSKLFDFFEASGWINSTKRHRAALASVD